MTRQDVSFAQDLLADQMAGSIYIGRFREAGGGTVPVIDKATGEVLFTSGVASPEDVADACRAAKQAQEQWAQRPPIERAATSRITGRPSTSRASAWMGPSTSPIAVHARATVEEMSS